MATPTIISLVPSLTELLFDLGLEEQIIARTRFCIYPEHKVSEIPIIGGTKNPDLEQIKSLNPDFIIANKEENRKEDVDKLNDFSKVIVTDITTVEQAIWWIKELGYQLECEGEANHIAQKISDLQQVHPTFEPLECAYLIWKDPWMTVGGDTYINDVMDRYGLSNVFSESKRYPTTGPEELAKLNPKVILLSSEPYPFKEEHRKEILEYCPDCKVELINGEWFSWYGSRMVTGFELLNEWRENFS